MIYGDGYLTGLSISYSKPACDMYLTGVKWQGDLDLLVVGVLHLFRALEHSVTAVIVSKS